MSLARRRRGRSGSPFLSSTCKGRNPASWTPAGPATDLKSLDAYKISPNEIPVTVALKIDDMIQGLSPAVVNSGVNDITQDNLSQTILLVFKI